MGSQSMPSGVQVRSDMHFTWQALATQILVASAQSASLTQATHRPLAALQTSVVGQSSELAHVTYGTHFRAVQSFIAGQSFAVTQSTHMAMDGSQTCGTRHSRLFRQAEDGPPSPPVCLLPPPQLAANTASARLTLVKAASHAPERRAMPPSITGEPWRCADIGAAPRTIRPFSVAPASGMVRSMAHMDRFRETLIGAVCLVASASLVSCTRSTETSPPSSSGRAGTAVGEDLKGVAKETEKTAKDIGRATVDLADRAGKRIEEATKGAGVSGDDAWITTKVKSELTAQGFDPLHMHVDTAGKVVTLSGTVETAADAHRAVDLAKGVKGVTGVQDQLVVRPAQR